ncbi:MAG: CDP-diacylglycerol diphosphatase [Steroidobacteraceae bacterium]
MGAACLLALGAGVAAHGVGRNQLRLIVQQQCVPDWLKTHDPAPCITLSMRGAGPTASGFALLADQKGGAHFLLIPIQSITGIESPALRATGTLNFFDAAWKARGVLDTVVGRPVAREITGLAVNSIWARSQDQLHIHIGCLRRFVYDALRVNADRIGATWSPMTMRGFRYQAIRINGRNLDSTNPFKLLADSLPGAKDAMAQFTLFVAGMDFKDGPGFLALAGRYVPGTETLLDSSCALARGGLVTR